MAKHSSVGAVDYRCVVRAEKRRFNALCSLKRRLSAAGGVDGGAMDR